MELADRGRSESFFCFPRADRNRGFLRIRLDPGRFQVLPEPAVEVMADGDLSLLASLFPKPQNPLGPLVLEVPAPQTGNSADAGPGVGEGAEQSPVAEAHDMGGIDRAEQVPGLGDGESRGLAV